MRKETWEKIMGGIAVTILPDTRGGLLLQVKGPVSAEYRAQSAINKSVPADKLRGLKMPRLAAWDEIGMPHFSGTLDYVKEVEIPRPTGREILKIENVRHTARVFVNSKLAGERMWAPFEFEIGKFLKSGTNEIRIEVSNTLLNELTSYESYGYKNRNRALPKATKSELKSGAFGKAAIFERLP